MSRGVSTKLPTALPARFKRGVAWNVDRRRKAVREYAYDMIRLGESLGGLDELSEQELWIVEEAAYWHGRVLANKAAILSGREPILTPGEHQNATNTLVGLLKTLGTSRRAREIRSPAELLASFVPEPSP
jgi:hypothetical protein